MVESPMMRRMMGADASDELAKLVLDEFSFKIRAAAESSKKGLSAQDVQGLIDDFMEKGRDKTLVNFQHKFEEILREHYAHLTELPFFPEIQGFMQSSPVVAIALRGENAIVRIREMVGPTDSTVAEKGTLRGDFGQDKMKNVVHASDSVENGQAELKRFFADGELFG